MRGQLLTRVVLAGRSDHATHHGYDYQHAINRVASGARPSIMRVIDTVFPICPLPHGCFNQWQSTPHALLSKAPHLGKSADYALLGESDVRTHSVTSPSSRQSVEAQPRAAELHAKRFVTRAKLSASRDSLTLLYAATTECD
ncbi:hypothetical protein DV736_g1903, partial [Chaetothyriales sp. CBS 134916]